MSTMLPSKDPAETVVVSFLFASEVLAGETVSSCTVVASVYAGLDPTPAAVLSGTVDLSLAPTVMQKVAAGVDGTTYLLKATATLSTGRVLIRKGILPVTSA